MNNNIKRLLERISDFQKYEDLRKQHTGEDFNIFNILKIEQYEVTTHSRFISNMLNPKGTHSQGAIFLNAFLKNVGLEDFGSSTNLEESKVEVEHSCDDGRMDIIISIGGIGGNKIVIENKIYAGLQEKQLARYINSLEKDKNIKSKLLYLTLGDFANDEEEKNMLKKQKISEDDRKKYQHITYSSEILNWMEECRRLAVGLPSIRECISQYIQTIRKLTNTNMNSSMMEKIFEITQEDGLYKTYKGICDNYLDVKKYISNKLFEALTKKIRETKKYKTFKCEFNVEESILTLEVPELENVILQFKYEDQKRSEIFAMVIKNNGKSKDEFKHIVDDLKFKAGEYRDNEDSFVMHIYYIEDKKDFIEENIEGMEFKCVFTYLNIIYEKYVQPRLPKSPAK
ncbi:MAG: PD-(D/E)XK nuclease family protein [Opitutales bacterium]|nr:PD-(D/E)XK nuclease family protein [Opitutales bacterium]